MHTRLRYITKLLSVLIILLSAVVATGAQQNMTEPVVFSVLFYSPTCPHCHEVITNHVPVWEEEFGDTLILLFVDVTQQGGSFLFRATCDALEVESCGSVPMMVIGEDVLIGSVQIPDQAPELIREGLAGEGVDLPPVPELREAYTAYVAAQQSTSDDIQQPDVTPENEPTARSEDHNATAEPNITPEATEFAIVDMDDSEGVHALSASMTSESWLDKLGNDPEGNAIALVTLLALVMSLSTGLWYGLKGTLVKQTRTTSVVVAGIATAGILLAFTLFSKSSGDIPAGLASGSILLLLLVSIVKLGISRSTDGLTPLVALAGLLAATYLARVEVSDINATCGIVGDCNTVQQSDYARLFGILPIGVLGMFGYVVIFITWLLSYFWNDHPMYGLYAKLTLLSFALFGVVFSIYLTFLEPFVIGATCSWCIISALLMMLILWIVSPSAWQAFHDLRQANKAESVPLAD